MWEVLPSGNMGAEQGCLPFASAEAASAAADPAWAAYDLHRRSALASAEVQRQVASHHMIVAYCEQVQLGWRKIPWEGQEELEVGLVRIAAVVEEEEHYLPTLRDQ